MNIHVRKFAILVAAAAAAAHTVGCAPSPRSDTRLAYRVANMANTIGIVEDAEVQRPRTFNDTLGVWTRGIEQDARKTGRHPELIDQYYRFQFKRWNDRQPFYRRTLEGVFSGQPERIEGNAITLFY
ncbi:MAG: hypothetical protein CHACPFDD_03822 [Phycisphaerae bacterium]|nr:hypothetical protein [Phycisphaerae bacterium]